MFFVYLIENLINGKLYVGKTNDVKGRWREHQAIAKRGKATYPSYSYIHSAISKYGATNFQVTTLGWYESEEDSLINEAFHIANLKAEGHQLYNLTNGGRGVIGRAVSEETKQKMSLSKLGSSNPFYGLRHTEDSKHKMSVSSSGVGNGMFKKQHSNESKHKISLSHIGFKHSELTRQKISTGHSGKKLSEEHKKKLSLAKAGSNGSNAKLSWAAVEKIRALNRQGVSFTKLSIQFGVCRTAISRVCKNKTWIISKHT